MNTIPPRLSSTFLATLSGLAISLFAAVTDAQVAIKAKTIHTMAGSSITDGVIVITDGKIAAIGPAVSTTIPQGHEILEAAVATPGLIDPRGTAGLTGIYNGPHDSDQLERSAPMQPELRALDAYNPQEELITYLRELGITTLHTGHAPGRLISGQTMIVKTIGNTVEEAVLKSPAMISATLGPDSTNGAGSPGTRGKQIAMLREELLRARDFLDKRTKATPAAATKPAESKPAGTKPAQATPAEAPAVTPAPAAVAPATTGTATNTPQTPPPPPQSPDRNLRMETLADVLEGKLPLLVHADRAQDIENALRLREEFGFTLILESAAESYLLIDQIKNAHVDVIVHPLMQRAVGDAENQNFETPAKLHQAGIRIGIGSGYEGYVPKTRVVLFEAAIAAANGLDARHALASITIDAARILGIDSRVGSLAVGKDGDIALFDGDPFEFSTHCVGVVIEGRVVSRAVR
jgi:imidazolonepropionase-like amidohydrolase